MTKIKPSEITPQHTYMTRREFMKAVGVVGAGALLASCTSPEGNAPASATGEEPEAARPVNAGDFTDELGDAATSFEDITNYNNFYEFTTKKEQVAPLSRDFVSSPWAVTVGGLVNNPGTYDLDDLRTQFDQEERVYRLRCVEGWSMVIPWMGFPLAKLLEIVQPKAEAQYVRFETLHDSKQFPGQKSGFYDWPYVEGLRLDEAMNDLTLLATGLYGQDLLPQSGAPIRLVVPWKYGFKSIKSIVKIDLVPDQPVSLWMAAAPGEYGFYSNVNPEVPHPRWSQANERRIGEISRRPTLPFNGYEEEVAHLYEGMDLTTPNDQPYQNIRQ